MHTHHRENALQLRYPFDRAAVAALSAATDFRVNPAFVRTDPA